MFACTVTTLPITCSKTVRTDKYEREPKLITVLLSLTQRSMAGIKLHNVHLPEGVLHLLHSDKHPHFKGQSGDQSRELTTEEYNKSLILQKASRQPK